MKPLFLPSLLAADLGCLASEIRRAAEAGSDAMHIDVMDGVFVPNISYGPAVVELCRRVAPDLPRNVHLMLQDPSRHVEAFARAGATTILVHVESDCDVAATLRRIRELGCGAGAVLNPLTPVERAFPFLPLCDEILRMTVHPGFGGQKFVQDAMEGLERLRAAAPEKTVMVDGGITDETLPVAAAAGANAFVAGSFLFMAGSFAGALRSLKRAWETAGSNGGAAR